MESYEIVIEHGDTKRKINGSFNICGPHNLLKEIAHQILDQVNQDVSYGWIFIQHQKQKRIVNIKPKGWDE